jgi:hypothetical protein
MVADKLEGAHQETGWRKVLQKGGAAWAAATDL